jgi:hypothetical protein
MPATALSHCHGSAEAFTSAEEAWFWAYGAWRARHQGAAATGRGAHRACDPDDILLLVERLLRSRRIDASHATVLGRWGERQVAPSRYWGRPEDIRLWQDAMAALGASLGQKGLLARTH